MLEGCKNARERWSGVHEMIDKWLQERQELIVCYTELAHLVKTDTAPGTEQVQALCDVMVDYTSAGHFEIFEQLCREAEAFSDQDAIELSQKIFPLIQKSTDVILDFNEAYGASTVADEALAKLPDELSRLGEFLADRFQHEDTLIETLHTAHRELVDS
ncbi:sigma D regulator [Oceanospirillum sanctuarii]|uniref:sigma D regulator n=1 Tax=Oceanospirillum sanctuarii TaxID=1434821 RepID=UPI000A3B67AC|nr:sigma D regulator [Oceanospirillum sanctuarii]